MGALQKTFFRHIQGVNSGIVETVLKELDTEIGIFIKPKISRGSQIKFKFHDDELWIFETVWYEGELNG